MSLKSFGAKSAAAPAEVAEPTVKRKPEQKALALRLSLSQWRRVKELALDQGTSVQALAMAGLSRIFTDQGLPGLEE